MTTITRAIATFVTTALLGLTLSTAHAAPPGQTAQIKGKLAAYMNGTSTTTRVYKAKDFRIKTKYSAIQPQGAMFRDVKFRVGSQRGSAIAVKPTIFMPQPGMSSAEWQVQSVKLDGK